MANRKGVLARGGVGIGDGQTVRVRVARAFGQEDEEADQRIWTQVNGVAQHFTRGDTVDLPVPLYLALRHTGRYDI